ncbi:glycoside hydrolase family 130 protein [Phnomibacter ginsenosidimutans]|uniref:4-O-beta-D-mannosyl-D-glucose phosphorylase n=1 Tax=Phnomibacter ginsenosidimutans TaxID=2676868 RepID=A0A6I6GYI0_9BACT|nr:glycosidase [Phnomibacter ginsenosidimutans]QGW27571.1 glycosidase [Phnomibacter ginsenosidimutans]
MKEKFYSRFAQLTAQHELLLHRPNQASADTNGIVQRYTHPVLTAAHVPLGWRYDLNPKDNPYLMERIAVNAVLNAGAIKWQNKYLLMARVEGADRKSYFAIAESEDGVQGFRFWDTPCVIPETDDPDTNVYDIRLVAHEDGWIYGLFCTERRAKGVPASDQSSAVAQCGIVRTHDLKTWERLPDLITPSPQQRNVVLHPEFVQGKYAFYTRPQDGFIDAGRGGGIGLGFATSMEQAVITEELLLDKKMYHTVYELKNGLGPAPIKTPQGWLHLAHGVRNTAAGLRYVLYLFMTDLADIGKVIYKPAGYFMAPEGEERIGDVSNVLFSNGWIADEDGRVLIYYASSDTRMHVAVSSIDQLLDYVMHTPADTFRSAGSVANILSLIQKNNAQAVVAATLYASV